MTLSVLFLLPSLFIFMSAGLSYILGKITFISHSHRPWLPLDLELLFLLLCLLCLYCNPYSHLPSCLLYCPQVNNLSEVISLTFNILHGIIKLSILIITIPYSVEASGIPQHFLRPVITGGEDLPDLVNGFYQAPGDH